MPIYANDFPLLQQEIRGKPLVYLDSGSSSQKPQVVVESIQKYYYQDHANVHRGAYTLSERATCAYETARKTVQHFINAAHEREIIFTRGATESINLVANCFGRLKVREGDEIIISVMEHHANIVPWQVCCEQTGAKLRVIEVEEDGTLNLSSFNALLNNRTKLVALIHVSNVLGTINPVKSLISIAHQQKIPVLLDGAQAVAHLPVDVQDLDCDFYAFSSHKLYGPTGIGVLYGKTNWLEQMPPYQTGGSMIKQVSFKKTEYADLPYKFEAGTPPIAAAVGLRAAINYLQQIGFDAIVQHEQQLIRYAAEQLVKIPGLRILGSPAERIGLFSFTMSQAHAHDVATILDDDGIAVRAGHHCAMPLLERFAVPATVRVSLGLYNKLEDIDRLVQSLHRVVDLFG